MNDKGNMLSCSFGSYIRFLSYMAILLIFDCCSSGFEPIDTDKRGESWSFQLPGLIMHQSMAFKDGKALFVTPIEGKLTCHVYDLHNRIQQAEVILPYEGYSIPHANVSCFGKNYYSDEDVFPTLYVSSWNNGRQAFVYNLDEDNNNIYKASLVQVIDPSRVSESIIGGGYLDWVVDAKGGYLYSISYHLKDSSTIIEGNYTHVTKFILPSYNYGIVHLTDADVVDYYSLPVMTVFQDKCYHDGHIYVVAGMPDKTDLYPPRLFDIDLDKKTLKEDLIPLYGEPEGLCYYQGSLWINMYGSETVYNLDKLLDL